MPLADLDDVRRVLRRTDLDDATLQPFLDSAEQWVERVYDREWDAVGSQTENFFNVRQGAILTVKDENPTGIVVTGFAAPASDGTVLTVNQGYAVLDRGRVQLSLVRQIAVQNIRPEEAEIQPPFTWARIQIVYTASALVPAPVREGVALIAAAGYAQSTADVGGLSSEKIGDYSYVRGAARGGGGELVIPKRARSLLAPYNRRRRVRSV